MVLLIDADSIPDQVMAVCEDTDCNKGHLLINSPAGVQFYLIINHMNYHMMVV